MKNGYRSYSESASGEDPIHRLIALLRRRFPNLEEQIYIAASDALQQCRLDEPEQPVVLPRAYTIAKHAILNELRRRRRLLRLTTLDPDTIDASELRTEDRILDRIGAEEFLQLLTENQAVTVRLHVIEGFTTRELATRFGISENAVKERLKTAMRRLRKFAREEGL